MMTCMSCHDVDGPFICDVNSGSCLCESCYARKEAVEAIVNYIKIKRGTKKLDDLTIVGLVDSVENDALDELGLK